MTGIEIQIDGNVVTKLQAARALNQVDSGTHVAIGEINDRGWVNEDVLLRARCHAYGEVQPPELSCMSFSTGTVEEMRQQAEAISIAAEIRQLADMLYAEEEVAPPAEHDETASPDRRETVRRAVELMDTAPLPDLRRYIAQTRASADLKADPPALHAALAADAKRDRVPFGTWKIAQQLLHAAGLPH